LIFDFSHIENIESFYLNNLNNLISDYSAIIVFTAVKFRQRVYGGNCEFMIQVRIYDTSAWAIEIKWENGETVNTEDHQAAAMNA
jgi:hypothetical protein